jgi:radical SAM protein with 4Fe4S-binding SPASM domain
MAIKRSLDRDIFSLDSHKLVYHPQRVSRWLMGESVFPIYIEVGIFGGCNHRCIFCAYDFLKYKPSSLPKSQLKMFIKEAAINGVRAILFSGEGEPLLNGDFKELVAFTKKNGIDVALATNGVFFDKVIAAGTLKYLSWVKVSLDAGMRKTYSLIHNADQRDYNLVIDNLKNAVRIKRKYGYNCAIGVQSILIPQNVKEMAALAGRLKKIGVDYLVIKPYCQHGFSNNKISFSLSKSELNSLERDLEGYSNGAFQVILRRNAMRKIGMPKPYRNCYGLDFAAHLSSSGDLYPCNAFVGKKEFSFGNICNERFTDIWLGRRRKDVMLKLNKLLNVDNCRVACRLDEINCYLWKLKHPGGHFNFI